MTSNNLSDLANAYSGSDDKQDPFGRRAYVLPRIWTPAHVAKRLVQAFEIIDATTTKPGPKAFGNAWPAMEREWADLLDESARKNHAAAVEASMSKRHRPSSFEIEKAEEACAWPAAFLDAESQDMDALRLWVLANARGWNVAKILHRRRLQADAMIKAIHANAGVSRTAIADPAQLARVAKGVAASANVLIAEAEAAYRRARAEAAKSKPGSPKRALAERREQEAKRDAVFACKLAAERVAKIAIREQLVIRAPTALIRRSEVMPGRVFTQAIYDERRKQGAETISLSLARRGVAIR